MYGIRANIIPLFAAALIISQNVIKKTTLPEEKQDRAFDRLREEITMLRIEGLLYCFDKHEAKRRTGVLTSTLKDVHVGSLDEMFGDCTHLDASGLGCFKDQIDYYTNLAIQAEKAFEDANPGKRLISVFFSTFWPVLASEEAMTKWYSSAERCMKFSRTRAASDARSSAIA